MGSGLFVFFGGGGGSLEVESCADPEAICNFYLILQTVL